MPVDTYSVWCGNVLLADAMSLIDALIFVKALFNEYWNESEAQYIVKKNKQYEETSSECGSDL